MSYVTARVCRAVQNAKRLSDFMLTIHFAFCTALHKLNTLMDDLLLVIVVLCFSITYQIVKEKNKPRLHVSSVGSRKGKGTELNTKKTL